LRSYCHGPSCDCVGLRIRVGWKELPDARRPSLPLRLLGLEQTGFEPTSAQRSRPAAGLAGRGRFRLRSIASDCPVTRVGWDHTMGSCNRRDPSTWPSRTGFLPCRTRVARKPTRAPGSSRRPHGPVADSNGQPVLGDNGPSASRVPLRSQWAATARSHRAAGSIAADGANIARIKLVNPPLDSGATRYGRLVPDH